MACLVVQLCVGILYLWSAFKGNIVAAYSVGMDDAAKAGVSSAATMVSSYMIFAFVFGNLIGGFLNDKKGPKFTCFAGVILFSAGVAVSAFVKTIALLDFTYAIMAGLGSGFAYGACISCIQKWLPHKRGLASGLACSAFGLSTVVFTPVSNMLMEANKNAEGIVNFTPVFLTLAGVFAVLGLIACCFISLPDDEYIKSLNLPKAAASTNQNYTLGQAIKVPAFWCLFFSIFFINGTWNLCVPLIKDLGEQRGLTTAMALACVSFTGITNAAGRLIMASLSDKIGRINTLTLVFIIAIAALMALYACGEGSVVLFYIGICLIGVCFGAFMGIYPGFTADNFGTKNSSVNYGIMFFGFSAAGLIGPQIMSSIYKSSGAYQPAFLVAAVMAVVGLALSFVYRAVYKRSH